MARFCALMAELLQVQLLLPALQRRWIDKGMGLPKAGAPTTTSMRPSVDSTSSWKVSFLSDFTWNTCNWFNLSHNCFFWIWIELINFDDKSKITIHHHVGWPWKTYLTVTIKDLQRACTNSYLADPVNRNLGLSVKRYGSTKKMSINSMLSLRRFFLKVFRNCCFGHLQLTCIAASSQKP